MLHSEDRYHFNGQTILILEPPTPNKIVFKYVNHLTDEFVDYIKSKNPDVANKLLQWSEWRVLLETDEKGDLINYETVAFNCEDENKLYFALEDTINMIESSHQWFSRLSELVAKKEHPEYNIGSFNFNRDYEKYFHHMAVALNAFIENIL